MALWSSGVTWSSGTLWGPAPPPSGSQIRNNRKKHKIMKKNQYYPRRAAERPEWHANFAAKLIIHGPGLELTPPQVNNAVADNLTLAYALGDWKTNCYDMGPTGTAAIENLESGTPGAPFVFPTYTAPTPPTLPVGAAPVEPGALDRTFLLVQEIKAKKPYTVPIGLDLGIIGSESPPPPPGEAPAPRVTAGVIQGLGHQNARFKFIKDGHTGVWAESRRSTGDWEFLITSDKSPIIDDRPLLNPAQAEIREYRFRFWDNGKPNGIWTDVIKVTLSP